MIRYTYIVAFSFAVAMPAYAHHILGIPHYSYEEDYPQTPILTYLAEAGPNEVRMTGYPGRPEPGERCSLHVYIRRLDDGTPFDGTVTMTVMRDRFFREGQIIYGPMEAAIEENVFKYYPEFKEEANYTIRIVYEAEGAPWIIDLPMVVGEPGSPWLVLGSLAAGVVLFLIVMRAIRIKMRRRSKTTGSHDPSAAPVSRSAKAS